MSRLGLKTRFLLLGALVASVLSFLALFTSRNEGAAPFARKTIVKVPCTVSDPNADRAKRLAAWIVLNERYKAVFEREISSYDYSGEEFAKEFRDCVVDVEQRPCATNGLFSFVVKIDDGKLSRLIDCPWNIVAVDSSERKALLGRRDRLRRAVKEVERLLSGYPSRMYKATRVGMFEVAQGDRVDSADAKVDMTYEMSFCADSFEKLEKKFRSAIGEFALGTKSVLFEKYDEWDFRKQYESFWKECGFDKMSGNGIVSFLEEKKDKSLELRMIAVPAQIHRMAAGSMSSSSAIEFTFAKEDSASPVLRYSKADVSFWREPYVDFADSGSRPVEFRNWMGFETRGICGHFMSREVRVGFKLPADVIKNLKRCDIKTYSGPEAEFLLAKSSRDRYDMDKLAERGYVPAMISMVEDFGKDDDGWYPRAALLNSRHAQMKLGWKNSGFGFSIVARNGDYVVSDVQKGVPVKRDMVLKSINGTLTSPLRYYSQLSTLIGNIPAGETVHLEFANGKTVDVKALRK